MRRVYLLRADGRQRPLGVTALEDKIVQQAAKTVLEAIYEQDFVGFSYGFRPGKSAHDALDALTAGIVRKKVNWILDADIRGFFDNIDHEKLMGWIELRVADPRMLRLIQKWLKAGVSEGGRRSETKVGTPQGAVISPLLANIYLHYVLDRWVQQWRRREAKGDLIIVRYADDFVLGFEQCADAERFRQQLEQRLAEYELQLSAEKTRLIEFGRYAAERRRMHEPSVEQGRWLRRVLEGYYNYHAVPGNMRAMRSFQREVARHWRHVLKRRSQRSCRRWEDFLPLLKQYLPWPSVRHPYPLDRFAAIYPR